MIEAFDYAILNFFQQIHNEFLTRMFHFFTVIGEGGAVWIAIGIVLLLFRQTRKIGMIVLVSLLLCLIFGNGILKNVIARERPCWRHPEVEMLIAVPKDYSFPSGHTFSSFAAAVSLLYWNKKYGIIALVMASIIAMSRLYFFVHYPTDIIGGIVLGVILAITSIWCVELIDKRRKKLTERRN